MKSFIRDHIIQYMDENNLFNTNQHGFRKGRSCTTQLLEVFDHWGNIIDNGNSIDVIYLDIKKAFATASHNKLIMQIEAYKINKKNCYKKKIVCRPSVRPSVSQLSLNLIHGFFSNFSCGFPWAIRSDFFLNF